MHKVFIDGSAGTTGLRIADRLAARPDIELLTISEAGRKDVNERACIINSADLAFLCLPDAAAREVMPLVAPDVRILDTSTAHRTAPGWVYGFPELGRRAAIRTATRVAVPGCYATGFICLAAPLVEKGVLPKEYPFVCQGLSGYSGAGKSGIAAYTDPGRDKAFDSPRAYGLTLQHKHLPEMQAVSDLAAPPIFTPVVDDYYSGMLVTLPIYLGLAGATAGQLADTLADYYKGESQITVHPLNETSADGFLPGNGMAGSDKLEIFITANEKTGQALLMSRFDNLGKGSSGAAVQCMNLMLGCDETLGLE